MLLINSNEGLKTQIKLPVKYVCTIHESAEIMSFVSQLFMFVFAMRFTVAGGKVGRPIICKCFETGEELAAASADYEDSNRGTTVTFMSVSKTLEKSVTTTEKE